MLRLLREQTGALHQALDGRLRDGHLPPLSRHRYTAFLRATSAIVLPLEVPLAIRLGPIFVHERAGERRTNLTHDLALLGTTVAEPWPALPGIEHTADALGAAYVLLGSHLGGEVIARGLFGPATRNGLPTAYLRLYDGAVGEMWTRFTGALGRFGRGADHTSHQHVAAVAVAVFTAFGLALDREGVPR